ncbi:unnamed protein product [Meganyctiphanes norvegica]|uniref:Uncharacterized protein n=1 Tax=Meganyctiphanes norvegica TaxID=48144 RepID=A0AAV2S6K1_MEGNR
MQGFFQKLACMASQNAIAGPKGQPKIVKGHASLTEIDLISNTLQSDGRTNADIYIPSSRKAAFDPEKNLYYTLLIRKAAFEFKNESTIGLLIKLIGRALTLIKKVRSQSPHVKNPSCIGCQPVHQAAQDGHLEALRLLRGWGADVAGAVARDGTTPLHDAARNGYAHIAAVQLIQGAHTGALRNLIGCQPVHQAAQDGHLEALRLLRGWGADVAGAVARDGTTPLHDAARNGYAHIAEWLNE